MDRKIVYAGQVPLETDLLGSNLYAMIGLGHLAQALIGTGTVASGLACTPTTPASMSVKIGAGSLYSPQNVDNSAYSSITANTTDQIVKQAILLASENKTLALTAPTTPGNSVIYLIQAAYSDLDTDDTTLPYYNAANPSVPYSGPGGSGAAQSTRRKGAVNITAKVGIASTSPVAPAPDSGFVGLYTITVAYGATTITSGNIAVASGAPFLTSGPYLTPPAAAAIYAPLTGATFTGNVTVQGSGSATLGTSGDITAARVGGADGLLFFGTSGTRYLNYNGTRYILNGAELYCGAGNSLAWNAGNDGAGSGLDAGLFAGQLPSYYTDITSRLGYTPANKAGDAFTGSVETGGDFILNRTSNAWGFIIRPNVAGYRNLALASSGGNLLDLVNLNTVLCTRAGYMMWDAGNDGSGSGLDADVLRGKTPAQVVAGEFTLTVNTNGQCEQRAGGGMTQGNIIMGAFSESGGTYSVTFPVPFPNACASVDLTGFNGTASNTVDEWPQLVSVTNTGFTWKVQFAGGGTSTGLTGVSWTAFGH